MTHIDPPAAVSTITAKCETYNKIKISWDEAEDAYGYTVYVANSPDGKYSAIKHIKGSSNTSFVHTGRALGKEYYYKVASYKAAGPFKIYAESSERAVCATYLTTPAAPNAVCNANASITISWSAVSGAQKYYIYRSENGGKYSLIKTQSNTKYNDLTTVPEHKYSYYTIAAKGIVLSEPSSSTEAVASLAAPTLINAVSASASSVNVTWNYVSSATSYDVYVSQNENDNYVLVGSTKYKSFTVTDLETDAVYYFKVSAVKKISDQCGSSLLSSARSASPKINPVSIKTLEAVGTASVFIECMPDSSIDGYRFYRSDLANGEFTLIGESKNCYFSDKTVTVGQTYYYKVSTFKIFNGSMHLSSLSVAKKISAANNLSARKIGWITNNYNSYKKINEKYSCYDAHFIGDTDRKVIYLNFSYGTPTTNASKVLDTLKEKNVKAGFFTLIYTLKKDPDMINRIIDEGHILGNHTVNNTSLVDISYNRLEYEVNTMTDYVKSTYNYDMKFFSYPRGYFSIRALEYVHKQDYTSIFYSYTYKDYGKTPVKDSQAYNNLTKNLHPGAIYLLHLECNANANVLGEFIDYARANGYEIEPLDTLRNR